MTASSLIQTHASHLSFPPEWQVKRLGMFATKVGSGATPRGGKSVYLDSRISHALIRSQHVLDRRFHANGLAFISRQDSDELKNVEVQSGDILLNITGDGVTFARACIVPDEILPACVNQHVSIIRVDQSVCIPGYLLAYLTHPLTKTYIESFNTGGSRRAITKGHIESFEVPLPPLGVQRRIAGILSAYDDLIENNQRRIKILEEMTRSLYREWFVHFRFTGHDKVKMVPSPLGLIPQGWEEKRLEEIAEDMRRNVPKGQLDQPQPYVGLEHIPRRSLALDAWEMTTDLGSNKLEFKKGEVLFGKIRPYFHKVSVAPFDGLCSADTIVIRARRQEHYVAVVACVSSDAFVAEASATANGAKMPRANWDVLEKYPIVVPNGKVAEKFSALMADIIAQQQALIFQIQNLRRTRDLLLPRLLSGQLTLISQLGNHEHSTSLST
jgi:type I restriction enzyme, S subunit